MSRPWTGSHELLLGFHVLAGAEDAVFDDKLSRRDQSFGHEERLIVFSFDGVGKERAWECFGIVKLQICDEVVDFNERTDDLGHDFQLLQQSILAHVVQLQRSPQILGLQLLIVEDICHRLEASNVGLRSISSCSLSGPTLRLERLLDEVIEA